MGELFCLLPSIGSVDVDDVWESFGTGNFISNDAIVFIGDAF